MESFTLVSTDHLRSGMLFEDEDDFRAGMNIVAICSHLTKIKVLAFIPHAPAISFTLFCDKMIADFNNDSVSSNVFI